MSQRLGPVWFGPPHSVLWHRAQKPLKRRPPSTGSAESIRRATGSTGRGAAPWARRSLTTSKCSDAAAEWMGPYSSLLRALTSAPREISRLMTSPFPPSAAACNGVSPVEARSASMSEPCSISIFTTFRWPLSAAACSGVPLGYPLLDRESLSEN